MDFAKLLRARHGRGRSLIRAVGRPIVPKPYVEPLWRKSRKRLPRQSQLRPPGVVLREIMEHRRVTVAEVATAAGYTRRALRSLLGRRRGLAPKACLRLGPAIGVAPELLLEASSAWELRRALVGLGTQGGRRR